MRRAPQAGKSLMAQPTCSGTSRSSVVEPLPSLVGHAVTPQDQRINASKRASTSLARSRSSVSATVGLTPSLARIADKDVVVEVRGGALPPPFRVGGKNGNIVTNSTMSRIHRGWRIVGVSGQRVAAQDVASAIAAAQKAPRYTVTFRIGTEHDEDESGQESFAECEAARLRREAEEQEELRRQQQEKEAQEREKERLEQERLDRERKEAEAAREKAAKLEVARQEAETSLEKSTGLPPREKIEEPQRALMAALAGPKDEPQLPKKKPQGPCDKCDGPHDADECPHFKKPRDDHKDALENYGSKKGTGATEETFQQLVLRSAQVVPQPGDGSCLFHSLAYGLKGASAATLRAEIADYIAANPEAEVAKNPISDWVLWDSGLDHKSYALSMREGSRWGGAVELAVCAKIRKVCVDVFEKRTEGFVRISSFGETADMLPGTAAVKLLYGGRVHYDAIQT